MCSSKLAWGHQGWAAVAVTHHVLSHLSLGHDVSHGVGVAELEHIHIRMLPCCRQA